MSKFVEDTCKMWDEMESRINERNARLLEDINAYYETHDIPDLEVIEAMSKKCDEDIASIMADTESKMGQLL